MSENINPPITVTDFEDSDWQTIISDVEEKVCFHYFEVFRKKQTEARDGNEPRRAAVYTILADIALFYFVPSSATEPFKAALVMGGKRSAIPSDFGNDVLNVLQQLIPRISDAEIRARIADVVWLQRRDYAAAQSAIDAYLESASRLETTPPGVNGRPILIYSAERVERALRLARMLSDTERFDRVTEYAEHLTQRLTVELSPVSIRLMDLLIEFRIGDSSEYAELALNAAQRSQAANFEDTAREFFKRRAEWLQLLGDREGQRVALIAAADTYVRQADLCEGATPPNYLLVADFLSKAIEANRQVGGRQARVEELHKRLLNVQPRSGSQMGRISSPPIDVKPIVDEAIVRVRGKSFLEALLELAQQCASPSVKGLREQVQRQAKDAPLIHMLAAVVTDTEGKVVSRKPSLVTDDPDQIEEGMRYWMGWHLNFHRALTAHAVIEPVRQQILLEHSVNLNDWNVIVNDNPLVPSGREGIFRAGLHAGLTGDFLSSAHILIPQLENSFRYVLSSRGVTTSKIDKDGIQRELYLQEMLPLREFKTVFSEDLAFDLEMLLVQRGGPNLRHRFAHGMLDHKFFFSAEVLYLWGLVLRIASLPVLWRLTSTSSKSMYEHDYSRWAESQARAVKGELLSELDGENLAEEIGDLGKSERRALTSFLTNILTHFLKLSYWTFIRSENERSWRAEIDAFRIGAKRVLRDNPALKSHFEEILADAWEGARAEMSKESAKSAMSDARFENLAERGAEAYPSHPPWNVDQLLDDELWPNGR